MSRVLPTVFEQSLARKSGREAHSAEDDGAYHTSEDTLRLTGQK
jgi:hypothetical protein